MAALRTVVDPEIGLDLVTLGLIYDVRITGSVVTVVFSLTTQGCPMQGLLTDAIRHAVSSVPGVEGVVPELVWDPRWHPGMIQEGAW